MTGKDVKSHTALAYPPKGYPVGQGRLYKHLRMWKKRLGTRVAFDDCETSLSLTGGDFKYPETLSSTSAFQFGA